MIRALLVFLILTASAAQAAMEWFPPRFDGGRLLIVPEPHYNSRDHFGLSLEAIHPFRTGMQSDLSRDSEFRLLGRVHTTGNGAAEAATTTFFGEGRWYLKAKMEYRSLIERFWGVGPDTPDDAEELYRPQQVRTYVELFHRVVAGLRLGGRLEWNDFKYVDVEEGGLLDTVDYLGLRGDNATGIGLVGEWDRRDNVYAPRRGMYVQGFTMFFLEALNGDYDFQTAHLDLRSFHAVGQRSVLAFQFFAFANYGDAPIWRYAALGGRAHSRGYNRGRFLGRRMAATQLEWRFPVRGRLDMAAFAGVAAAADDYDDYALETLRPTLGVGWRLHVRKDRDLMLLADLAFGESNVEGYLSFGHAF